jgi:hypothetical protein
MLIIYLYIYNLIITISLDTTFIRNSYCSCVWHTDDNSSLKYSNVCGGCNCSAKILQLNFQETELNSGDYRSSNNLLTKHYYFDTPKMTIFWVVALCSVVEIDRRFWRAYYLYNQGCEYDDKGSKFVKRQNVPDYTSQYPRSQHS